MVTITAYSSLLVSDFRGPCWQVRVLRKAMFCLMFSSADFFCSLSVWPGHHSEVAWLGWFYFAVGVSPIELHVGFRLWGWWFLPIKRGAGLWGQVLACPLPLNHTYSCRRRFLPSSRQLISFLQIRLKKNIRCFRALCTRGKTPPTHPATHPLRMHLVESWERLASYWTLL